MVMRFCKLVFPIWCFYCLGLASSHGAEAQAIFDEPERIVVLGDIHGDYEGMRAILLKANIINRRGNWIGGKTHLVQLGDLPDRGNETQKVIKFLRKLEKQAKRKRGRVHILIGNHDAMNVYGDLRYVTQEEFSEFAGRNSIKRLQRLYETDIKWIQENIPEEEWPVFDDQHRIDWFKSRPPGFVEHRWAWLPGGEIGDWVASRNAVIRIGKYLFVHGGIGPTYSASDITSMNRLARAALKDVANVEQSILRDQDGPLWYRGQATGEGEAESANLEAVLNQFGANHMIVGHTVTSGVILPRFGGKVILADVGMSSYYGSNRACLVIEGGKLHALHKGGRVEIPVNGDSSGLLEYLKKVSEMEPGNIHIRNRIRELEFPEPDPSTEVPEIDPDNCPAPESRVLVLPSVSVAGFQRP